VRNVSLLHLWTIFAVGGLALPIRAADSIAISIDATATGYAVPSTFVGLSVSRNNISGSDTYEQLFNPSRDSFYPHLTNLYAQIGVKHIRVISGIFDSSDPDPSAVQDDRFFTFCQASGVAGVIYSLHLFNETGTDDVTAAQHIWTTPADKALLESFALDNETDWAFNYRSPFSDPVIRGYTTPAGEGYRDKWTLLYSNIQAGLGNPSPPAPFAGPDTGSNFPIQTNSAANTSINGVPYTLRCVLDQYPRIQTATQHYYGGNSSIVPTWILGSAYFVNDEVLDPKDLDPFTGDPVPFVCITNVNPSNNHPQNSTFWARVTPIWVSGTTYSLGAIVQDPTDSDNFYQDSVGGISTTAPSSDSSRWTASSDPSQPSALQLSESALGATNLPAWGLLYSNALAGASSWPAGLPYRLTESSPYSNNGGNPGLQTFGMALWGLDYFCWWAMHGCAGINPFTRVAQDNSPIFQVPSGDFVAVPYAYGLKAFSLGSQGTTINASGMQISNPAGMNLTAYAVVGLSDLYVTIINKTFSPINAQDALVTINPPSGFLPISARSITMTSGTDGNVTSTNAMIGGAIIPTTGGWNGIWNALPLTNGSCTLTVQAASAVIVDLQAVGKPVLTSPQMSSNGIFSFTVVGPAGYVYAVQNSTDCSHWNPMLTTSNTSGSFQVYANNPPTPPGWFYRAVLLPK
jgi:hypothetical protein